MAVGEPSASEAQAASTSAMAGTASQYNLQRSGMRINIKGPNLWPNRNNQPLFSRMFLVIRTAMEDGWQYFDAGMAQEGAA